MILNESFRKQHSPNNSQQKMSLSGAAGIRQPGTRRDKPAESERVAEHTLRYEAESRETETERNTERDAFNLSSCWCLP